MVYLGTKNIAMLKSMKKPDPKKKVLSTEELAKQVNPYPYGKPKKVSDSTITIVKPKPFTPVNDDNTPESISRNLAYEKQRETDIAERESEDYGRNTPKGQVPYYDRQEMMDQINKPSIRKSIESLRARRAKMEEEYRAKTKPKSK